MIAPRNLQDSIEFIYEQMHHPDLLNICEAYHDRHETASLLILTLYEQQPAQEIATWLKPVIEDRVVAEIGAGCGLLAIEMAKLAKRVFAIESDPAWSWAFVEHLYETKPSNLTWIFGAAESVSDWLRCDLAVFVTRSGHDSMRKVACEIGVTVVDVIRDGDLDAGKPDLAFLRPLGLFGEPCRRPPDDLQPSRS
jgi:hypothetical protein